MKRMRNGFKWFLVKNTLAAMSCLWACPGRGGAGSSPGAWRPAPARRRDARGSGPRLPAAGSWCTPLVPSAPSPAHAAPAHNNNLISFLLYLHTVGTVLGYRTYCMLLKITRESIPLRLRGNKQNTLAVNIQ